MRRVLLLPVVVCLAVFTAKAQDPVKVDPKHYKVEFENDQVRVLRVHVGPKESSPLRLMREDEVRSKKIDRADIVRDVR